jgi:hypothetical protein
MLADVLKKCVATRKECIGLGIKGILQEVNPLV